MQRQWRDPRDNVEWWVTLSPFGLAVGGHGSRRRVTVSFHRSGDLPEWTRYGLARSLAEASDQELMDLLDEARRKTFRGRRMARVRASAGTGDQQMLSAGWY